MPHGEDRALDDVLRAVEGYRLKFRDWPVAVRLSPDAAEAVAVELGPERLARARGKLALRIDDDAGSRVVAESSDAARTFAHAEARPEGHLGITAERWLTTLPIVGFVGLGLMGKPMARNLLRAGYRVVVKSRRPDPEIELEAEGAERAATPAEVALRSNVVVTMLPNSPDVEVVALGAGVASGVEVPADARDASLATGFTCLSRPEGGDDSRMVIDMSTISPEVSRSIGERLAELGVPYLEAPVSGGDVGAIKGTLAIMAGGPADDFERARPIFEALGKSAVLMGPWGAGQTTKLANNVIAAITIEAVCEGAVLAARSGVDPLRMLEAIRGGAAACWSLDHKIPKIAARDFAPGFMCRLHLKDLNLALDAATARGMQLPLTHRVRDMFATLVDEGRGGEDNCALVRLIERLADRSE